MEDALLEFRDISKSFGSVYALRGVSLRVRKGEVIAQNVDDLHGDANKLTMQTMLTERGTVIAGVGYTPVYHDIMTGTQMDGRAFPEGIHPPEGDPSFNESARLIGFLNGVCGGEFFIANLSAPKPSFRHSGRLDEGLAQWIRMRLVSNPTCLLASTVDVFLIADSGYDPYTAVVITHGELLRSEPETAAALVAALREGWRGYLDDPGPANALMGARNPEMDAEAMRLAAEAQQPLIEVPGGALGSMRAERWTTLAGQLQQLGLITEPQPAAAYFANP